MQIGLTATPRKVKLSEETQETKADAQITADNYTYFGEPVYEYDLTQGIEDGYLATLEIINRDILINAKKELEIKTGVDQLDFAPQAVITDVRTGRVLNPEEIRQHYEAATLEKDLMLPDRVKSLSQDLFNELLANGGTPEQKTIIFCASDAHAQRIAGEMGNLYAAWCAQQGTTANDFYAFKCTRQSLINHLVAAGVSPVQAQQVGAMMDYDLYDVLAQIAYGTLARKRQERVHAFTYKHEDWLRSLPPDTSATIKAIIEPFTIGGTEELENPNVLQLPNVKRAGGMKALQATGKQPFEVLREAKERLFAA